MYVCMFVCVSVYSESAHLDGIALCLYYGYIASTQQDSILYLADFDVKALLLIKASKS